MVVREFCPPLINEGRTPLPPHGWDGDAAATPPSVLSEGRCLVDAPDPPQPFCGSRVEANWRGRHDWYAAVVMRVRGDGTYGLTYEDGETESTLRLERLGPAGVHALLRFAPSHAAADDAVVAAATNDNDGSGASTDERGAPPPRSHPHSQTRGGRGGGRRRAASNGARLARGAAHRARAHGELTAEKDDTLAAYAATREVAARAADVRPRSSASRSRRRPQTRSH